MSLHARLDPLLSGILMLLALLSPKKAVFVTLSISLMMPLVTLWARAMKLKSDIASAFKNFLGWLDCEHKKDSLHVDTISILQPDRGGDILLGVCVHIAIK